LELLVAMAIFLVAAGAAFALFNQHATLVTKQQNLSGLNIGLRNGMSMLEMDLAGASQNLLNGVLVSGAPAEPFYLGVIIQNNVPNVAATCALNTSDWSYPTSSACFDSLTIIVPKAGAPVLTLNDDKDLSATSTMNANDANNSANNAADIASFVQGDELLVYQPIILTTTSCYITVVPLTGNATLSGNLIQLPHLKTGAGGHAAGTCPGSTCTDPLGVIYNPVTSTSYLANSLYQSFQAAGPTYIINLGNGANNITYSVQANPLNSADPQLTRCVGTTCSVLTDQTIGFKVGAALWNNYQLTDIASYYYDASEYCNGALQSAGSYVDCTRTPPSLLDPYDYTLVRSMRISMIARTPPVGDLTPLFFKNSFDNGPYLVQQASVVVDIRNMSMSDLGN
jgi:hypothetical protein